MTSMVRRLAVLWIFGAVALSIGAFSSGDISILAGWLDLVWTAPFGMIWWFYVDDHVLRLLPALAAQIVGTIVVDVLAFLFWFVAIPRVHSSLTRRFSNK